jgi:hypothetical protein
MITNYFQIYNPLQTDDNVLAGLTEHSKEDRHTIDFRQSSFIYVFVFFTIVFIKFESIQPKIPACLYNRFWLL